jgi:peptidoglycan/xylan/chitin deacetylase (PgdA/CDA1 family)
MTSLSARLGCAFLGFALVLGGCRDGRDGSEPAPEPVAGRVASPLIAEPELYKGASLGAKQLILTFDDGPNTLAVTGDLSAYLKSKKIRATFFVNGACIATPTLGGNLSCGTPQGDAVETLKRVTADGHLVANHSTTHRDLTAISKNDRAKEIAETDALIAPYVPWNRFLFRAPLGSWNQTVFNDVSSTMSKYVGPIYWTMGGTDAIAADWACWDAGLTSKACGDRYLNEIRSLDHGIVLLHDRTESSNPQNHNINSGVGNTVDMVKYMLPVLEGEGFTFKAIEEDPEIAAVLPKCDPGCPAACTGPGPDQCVTCTAGQYTTDGACQTCSACAAGSFASTACGGTANTVCSPCAAGTFSAEAGAAKCTKCAAGTDSEAGATACTPCTNCKNNPGGAAPGAAENDGCASAPGGANTARGGLAFAAALGFAVAALTSRRSRRRRT